MLNWFFFLIESQQKSIDVRDLLYLGILDSDAYESENYSDHDAHIAFICVSSKWKKFIW